MKIALLTAFAAVRIAALVFALYQTGAVQVFNPDASPAQYGVCVYGGSC